MANTRLDISSSVSLALAKLDRLRCSATFNNKPRILATACWTFPVYSHSFVYQELTQLIKQGFQVRLLYGQAGKAEHLGESFTTLWSHSHRFHFNRKTGQRDYEYYKRRHPFRVKQLVAEIAASAKLSEERVCETDHFLFACSFARYADLWGANYIHSYFFYESSLFAMVASRLQDIPRGVSCYADHNINDYKLKMVELHLDQAAIVVATSERIKNELISIKTDSHTKILVKPNAINVLQWEYKERPSDPANPTIVAVSRIDPKKGLNFLIEACALLRKRCISCKTLILGAPDQSLEAELHYMEIMRLVEHHKLLGLVDFAGAVVRSQVREALYAADIFVAPSVDMPNGDKDGIPTALLEAMATGAPVVVSDGGSITEVIEHEVNGMLSNQRDVDAFATNITRLLSEPNLRLRLGIEARRTVEQLYDVEVCEWRFHERIRRVMGQQNSA